MFLGFCNFYRRFISGYSNIVAPLTSLLKGSKQGKKPGPVEFGEGERAAFRKLLEAFRSAPLLHHFDPEKLIWVATDAFIFGKAGMLSWQTGEGSSTRWCSGRESSQELSWGMAPPTMNYLQ